MARDSKVTKAQRARTVSLGLKKHFKASDVIAVRGKSQPVADLLALFASHVAALDEVGRRYGAYRQAVVAERALAAQTQALWLGLQGALENLLGPLALPDFGMKPKGKPGPKTTVAKLAGVEKRAAKAKKKKG